MFSLSIHPFIHPSLHPSLLSSLCYPSSIVSVKLILKGQGRIELLRQGRLRISFRNRTIRYHECGSCLSYHSSLDFRWLVFFNTKRKLKCSGSGDWDDYFMFSVPYVHPCIQPSIRPYFAFSSQTIIRPSYDVLRYSILLPWSSLLTSSSPASQCRNAAPFPSPILAHSSLQLPRPLNDSATSPPKGSFPSPGPSLLLLQSSWSTEPASRNQ